MASGGADDLIHLYDMVAERDLGSLMNPCDGAVPCLQFFTPEVRRREEGGGRREEGGGRREEQGEGGGRREEGGGRREEGRGRREEGEGYMPEPNEIGRRGGGRRGSGLVVSTILFATIR